MFIVYEGCNDLCNGYISQVRRTDPTKQHRAISTHNRPQVHVHGVDVYFVLFYVLRTVITRHSSIFGKREYLELIEKQLLQRV